MMWWQHSVDICPCWLNMHLSHSFLKDRLTQMSIQSQSSVSMSAGPFQAIVHRSSEYPTFKTTCFLCVHLHESKSKIIPYYSHSNKMGNHPQQCFDDFSVYWQFFHSNLNRIAAICSSQFVNFLVNHFLLLLTNP